MSKILRSVRTVESHTEGMPTRVVVDGFGEIPGSTMFERRAHFMANSDGFRKWLMFEPRGHSAMSGAILQKPTRSDADWGVVYIEVSGCLPMCGHGTIGVATVLVEKGLVKVTEPVTTIKLDTPAGLVVVDVAVKVKRENGNRFLDLGLRISDAINEQNRPVHPENPEIAICHHVDFIAPGDSRLHWRNAMAIHPGWFDRSPCGTGTSARLAQMVAKGEMRDEEVLINESWIGSIFEGRIKERTRVGNFDAIVPTIRGRAWVMGEATWTLDASDPFPEGFLV
ncbi:MAG: proline racemase [Actinobacteria bacterium]|nr:proline racemase [Actinomycetota bacterium]